MGDVQQNSEPEEHSQRHFKLTKDCHLLPKIAVFSCLLSNQAVYPLCLQLGWCLALVQCPQCCPRSLQGVFYSQS